MESLTNAGRLIQKFLPKWADIDKILKVIQRKVLKCTHLPVAIKEIQAGYLFSPYFKDIYLFLAKIKYNKNKKLPSTKTANGKVEMLAENYIVLDSLLFNIVITTEKETALLAIPEVCVDKVITLYHSSLFTGHQGVIKTYLTMGDKFFIPNLIHYLCSYIKACHICQLTHNEKPPTRQLQTRINLIYRPLQSWLSIDLTVMPRLYKGHKFILCRIDYIINYLITVPTHQSKSEEIGNALIENAITKYCVPEYIIMDEDSTFMSSFINYLFKKFDNKIRTVALYNHKLLQAEHGIKSLSNILMKHLTNLGQMGS